MLTIIKIIAIISLLAYGINIISDVCDIKKPFKAHITYGVIAILSSWYLHPMLSFFLCCILIPYSLIILISYIKNP